MDFKNLSARNKNYEEIQEKGIQKIAASHQILDMKSADSLTMDMEPFSHYDNKDLTLGSRINLQKSPSKQGSEIRAEKKTNSASLMDDVHGDITIMHTPKASLVAGSMPEKLILANKNTDQIAFPQTHHQITIITDGTTTTTTKPAGIPTKSSVFGKRSNSFKQSSIINPRRILFFFATLSSVGTILLICLTLSMTKYNEDDNSHPTKLI